MPEQSPALIKLLVKQLRPEWQQSAALCLLPVLSTACGWVSYSKEHKPLAFQVALYGLPGTGKTSQTYAPAKTVQEMLNKLVKTQPSPITKQNWFRTLFSTEPADSQQQKSKRRIALGLDTSTAYLHKVLSQCEGRTHLLFSDELESALSAEKGCAFMQLKPLIRQGYDGTMYSTGYKNSDSFSGEYHPRISLLANGTPEVVFKYFDNAATNSGTARRMIFVEHIQLIIKGLLPDFYYTEEELKVITKELEYLMRQFQTVQHDKIDEAANQWAIHYQEQAAGDLVKLQCIGTQADTLKRAAYLAHVLNHYDEAKVNDAIAFGTWVAEYQMTSYINKTYAYLSKQAEKQKAYFSPSTQVQQQAFNDEMFANLPNIFSVVNIKQYREEHDYPYKNSDPSYLLTRWRERGLVESCGNKQWKKIEK